MSSKSIEDVKEQEFSDAAAENQVGNDEDQKELDQNSENPMPSPEQEEEIIKKKYGGMLSKKKPLISMQGAQKPKGPLEALRPKLQPTPQHQMRSRRSAYAPADDDDAEDGSKQHPYPEDESCESQGGDDENSAPEDQTCNRGDDEKSAPDVQTCSA